MATLVSGGVGSGIWANFDNIDTIFEKDDGMLEGIETCNPSQKIDLNISAHDLHLAMADFVPVTGYELIIACSPSQPSIWQLLGLYVCRASGAYVAVLTDEGTIVDTHFYDKRQYALRLPSGKVASYYQTYESLQDWLESCKESEAV